ncbi:MAG: helix-turn-helix domain-containing protein [Coprobacillaceae bacterium]
MNNKILGDYIREQRTIRGLSLQQLSSYSEVSIAHLSRIERGDNNVAISFDLLLKLCEVMHISLRRMLLDCGYLGPEVEDLEIHRIIECFLWQPNVRRKYKVKIEKMSHSDKQDLLQHLASALHIILGKYCTD